ncbi:chondroitin proteoglycan 2-like [Onthophagus taurus]|uniref:chondroitin proteoglycan 2-like n=1 Tax=Onthophagus taurus TaxID=166361 RepID=UPI0039BE81BE
MKVTFLLCATFVLAFQYAKADPVGECPDDMNPEKVDFLVDDKDCTVFYKCDWGKPVKFDCPSDLHFNKELEVCDWPDKAGCNGDGGDDGGSSSSSSSSESDEGDDDEEVVEGGDDNVEEDSGSSSSSSSSESDESGDGNGQGKCPNDPCPKENGDFPHYFAHPETCGRFCQCDWGVAYDMPCPDGLHFNTKLNVCDWPADAGCSTFLNYYSNCSITAIWLSIKMKVTFLLCATFVLAFQYAKADPVGECPDTMNPEKVDFLVDDNDCTVFYKCDWGKPVKFDCPSDLHFNKELEVCDWPDKAGCNGDGGDDGGSSSSSSSSESDEGDDDEEVVEGGDDNVEEDSGSSSSSSSSESDESGDGNGQGRCPSDPCPKENGEFPHYFAHPETCGRFCQCDWGVAYDMPCPDGLHFNTKLNVCDWPADAGCEFISDFFAVNIAIKSNSTFLNYYSNCSITAIWLSIKMKVTFLLCATFVLAFQYAKADPVGECPDTMNPEKVDFLVDDNDCTVFYKCDWGKPVKFDCPSDLHFNKELEVCDWPDKAGCNGDGGDDGGSSSSSSSSESDEGDDDEDVVEGGDDNVEEDSSSSSSSSSSESDESGDGNGQGKCPNDPCPKENGDFPHYFAHPESCGRFCQCDWGVAYDMPCPDGLHFNTKLNVCDWPADAGCE